MWAQIVSFWLFIAAIVPTQYPCTSKCLLDDKKKKKKEKSELPELWMESWGRKKALEFPR